MLFGTLEAWGSKATNIRMRSESGSVRFCLHLHTDRTASGLRLECAKQDPVHLVGMLRKHEAYVKAWQGLKTLTGGGIGADLADLPFYYTYT